jgi:ABC-type Fe3+/spermidine/putrescine transport system ATPase subunit
MHGMDALSLDRVSKSFGSIVAVADVSLDIPQGTFVTLLGPSGSGKSTILRIVAGLEQPDRGRVVIDGVDVTRQPAHARPSAMVFQRYALFPHMSVRRNVGFGLRQRGVSPAEIEARVTESLRLVSMSERAGAMPQELSGGQEQRVALARALVVRPRVLLLDEPLSALDAGLRRRMQQELLAIQRQTGITFLAVTHDQDEALTMSDRIVLLHEGRVMQSGPARDLFERPASRFVAEFMGAENVLPVQVVANSAGCVTMRLAGIDLPVRGDFPAGAVALVIRPEAVRIVPESEPGWNAIVIASSYKGSSHLVSCELEDGTRIVLQTPHEPAPGERVRLGIDADRAVLVPLMTAGDRRR